MKVHEKDGKWYQELDYLRIFELPALTLPLRAGQRVICRDGEERFVISVRGEIAYWTQEKVPDSCWYTRDGVYLRVKPHDYDAIADAPVRTADAKPDEKKEQAAAAEDVKAKASVISPANGPTPAAQPAILPTWTNGDCLAYADKHGLKGPARSDVRIMVSIICELRQDRPRSSPIHAPTFRNRIVVRIVS